MIRILVFVLMSFSFGLSQALAEPITIECPDEPPVVRRLQLEERWRIDTDDAEAPLMGYFYGNQVRAHDGRIYMLDQQLCHVLVYGDDGEHLDTIMREGDGPGEIRNPASLFVLQDGRIGVQNGYPTRIEYVDPDGTPRGRWRIACNAWVSRLQETPGGWFGVYSASKEGDDPGVFRSVFHAAIHDGEGERTISFHEEERKIKHVGDNPTDEADEYSPWFSACVDGDSTVIVAAARDEYRLEWRAPDGHVLRVVTRNYPAHERTEEELERLKFQNYSIVNGDVRFRKQKLCKTDPVIRWISRLPDGGLMVQTSLFEKDLPDGMVCRYEVHEATGELRERVEIIDPNGDYDPEYDSIVVMGDGRAMVLRNVRPASRAATDAGRPQEILEKMPPIPDDREDIAFVPIMCDLVPVP